MSPGSARRCSGYRMSVVLAVAGAALLAGCSSSGSRVNGSGTPVSVTTDDTASASPSAPTSSATSAPPSSSPAPTSSTSAAPPSTSSPPPQPKTTCTSLTIRVLPGGASPGEEIAALQFVNSGVKKCLLVGYPTVTLYLHGAQIGVPSEPSSTAPSMRALQPGDVAESLLHDYTQTCQAPLSDTLKVRVPGTRITYTRPHFQLRACVLRVDKLGAPD